MLPAARVPAIFLGSALTRPPLVRQAFDAEMYDDVSFLASDLVGFTAMSSKLSPVELVRVLNEIFTGAGEGDCVDCCVVGDLIAAGELLSVSWEIEMHRERAMGDTAQGCVAFLEALVVAHFSPQCATGSASDRVRRNCDPLPTGEDQDDR